MNEHCKKSFYTTFSKEKFIGGHFDPKTPATEHGWKIVSKLQKTMLRCKFIHTHPFLLARYKLNLSTVYHLLQVKIDRLGPKWKNYYRLFGIVCSILEKNQNCSFNHLRTVNLSGCCCKEEETSHCFEKLFWHRNSSIDTMESMSNQNFRKKVTSSTEKNHHYQRFWRFPPWSYQCKDQKRFCKNRKSFCTSVNSVWSFSLSSQASFIEKQRI